MIKVAGGEDEKGRSEEEGMRRERGEVEGMREGGRRG